jgi:hypothetical protein
LNLSYRRRLRRFANINATIAAVAGSGTLVMVMTGLGHSM